MVPVSDLVSVPTDEDVERAWRAGAGPGGLGELFRRHYRGVVSYLSRFTRDLGAAEDLAQQAFVRLLERRDGPPVSSPSAAGRFRSLIYTVARNLALNELRRQGRRYVARASITALTDDPVDSQTGPLEGLVASEELGAFRSAVDALPEEERACFWLKEVAGLTYQEAGTRLGLHPDAVRRRVAKAFDRLRGAIS